LTMRVFAFSPQDYVEAYSRQGYVHIVDGLNPEFLAFAREQAKKQMDAQKGLREWEFKGKKQQFLFEFGTTTNYREHVLQPIAQVTGFKLERTTLCERHIKAYDQKAPPNPPPHKDRLASQVAVGLPLEVPKDSYIIMYPDVHRDINPWSTTAQYRAAVDEAELPERLLSGVEPVRLDVKPGDVVMFKGSSIFHERVNPANTTLLYLKFNGMRLDPLGEDPRTPEARERSLGWLKSRNDAQLLASTIDVSPRLDRISRHSTRLHWKEVIQASVWNEKEFILSEADVTLIRSADGGRSGREILSRLGVEDIEYSKYLPALRRLIELNALEIVA
jgi:hypothetical protein